MTVPSPATVRQAAVLVALEGIAALVGAAVYVASGFWGEDVPGLSFFGTAVWFAIMGSAVLAAGWALWTGRRWGRGIAVFMQLLLLPVSWYVAIGSQQWFYGVPIAIVALITLVLLFSPSALEWLGAQDSAGANDRGGGGPSSSASAESAGPDTR